METGPARITTEVNVDHIPIAEVVHDPNVPPEIEPVATPPTLELVKGGLESGEDPVDTPASSPDTVYNYDRTMVSTADKVSRFLQKGVEKTNRFAARWARRRTVSQTIDQKAAAIGNAIDNKIDQAADWTDSKIDIVKAKAQSVKETGAHAIEAVKFGGELTKALFEELRSDAHGRKAARHERWAKRADSIKTGAYNRAYDTKEAFLNTPEAAARQAKRMGHAALSAAETGVSLAAIGTYKAKEAASASSEKARGFINQSLENRDTPAAMDVLAQRRAARAARLEQRAQKLQAQAKALRH